MENTNTANNTPTENNQSVDTNTSADNSKLESASISTEEHQKIVQSECDKIRTEYSKKVKALEGEIASLKPIEKSEAELLYEARLADLERKNAEVELKDKLLDLQSNLTQKGFSPDLVDFIKDDCDLDSFANALETLFAEKVKTNGFVPQGHNSNPVLTSDDFWNMTMEEQEKLYKENRPLYDKLAGKAK